MKLTASILDTVSASTWRWFSAGTLSRLGVTAISNVAALDVLIAIRISANLARVTALSSVAVLDVAIWSYQGNGAGEHGLF